MTIEQIKAAHERKPFRPFILHTADGGQISVQSPEFMLPAPSGRTIVICQPDDTMNIIDLLLVTYLEFKTQPNGSGKRRKP